MNTKKIYKLNLILFITFLLSCCNSNNLIYVGKNNFVKMALQNQLTSDDLSLDANNFLVTNCLLEQFENNPDQVITNCALQVNLSKSNVIIEHNYRSTLKVIIDLCIYQAKKLNNGDSIKYWMSTCYFSYRYLFDKNLYPPLSKLTTPDTGIVINYYNFSLYKIFSYLKENELIFKNSFIIPLVYGSVKFNQHSSDLPWKITTFNDTIICPNYEPENLNENIFQKGLGLPLAGIPSTADYFPTIDNNLKLIKYLYPCTFLIKFDNIESINLDISATPEYLDFYSNIYANMSDKRILLLNNYSTIVGRFLREYPEKTEVDYFFNPGDMMKDGAFGMYMLTPFKKNKIPVLFIHGLISDPQSMYQIINTLMQYHNIRENYQFWFYYYPTGQPIAIDAYLLRKILNEMKKIYSPDGSSDSKFDEMIVVGYSLGGLIAQNIIQDSKGDFFAKKVLHTEEIKKLDLSKEQIDQLISMLEFKPLSFVKQVIFISTPHKGAEMADWVAFKLLSDLISAPVDYFTNYKDTLLYMSKLTRQYNDNIFNGNAIDNLQPDSKYIKYSEELPFGKNIVIHSIIGDEDKAGQKDGTDGVVPYSSSHIPNAESEVIIKSDHHSIYKPACAKEILRILSKTAKEKQ